MHGPDSLFIMLIIGILGVILAGSVCGIVALVRLLSANRRLRQCEREIQMLRLQVAQARETVPYPAADTYEPPPAPATPPPPEYVVPVPPIPPTPRYAPVVHDKARERTPRAPEPAGADLWFDRMFKGVSLEEFLGLRTIAFVGAAMLLVGLALGLKHIYDNWVDEAGRLAIGVALSLTALGCGEFFRRKQWQMLFQAMTGAALAGFYVNIYFSFQVYHMATAPLAMALAVGVTLLAVVLAVAHNAMAIALLGMAGGFLSPVLLSTGENHPHALFLYVLVLDLVALGTGYYRQWRLLDKLAFLATAALYGSWYRAYYDADTQMMPALLYATVFYVLFLIIPMAHAMARRKEARVENLVLIAANALVSFGIYYDILFQNYRQAFGMVVIGQSLLVFLLFRAWEYRMGAARMTGQVLLVVSLALALVAVPVMLTLYTVAVVWAVQGVLLCWLGSRFDNIFVRCSGIVALALAVGDLYTRLPLHVRLFTPVFNWPFISWLFVITALAIAAYLYRPARRIIEEEQYVPWILAVVSIGLLCLLLSLETNSFWQVRRWSSDASTAMAYSTHQTTSLIVLWGLIVAVLAGVAHRKVPRLLPLAWAAAAVGGCILLYGVGVTSHDTGYLIFNNVFIPRLVFIGALCYLSWVSMRAETRAGLIIELGAWAGFILLGTRELLRWARVSELVTDRFGVSAISAFWAIVACALVWFGLASRCRERRMAGFVVFALTVAKVILVDTSQLERIYQVLSWVACGLLLVVAAVIYQHYSALLLHAPEKEEE